MQNATLKILAIGGALTASAMLAGCLGGGDGNTTVVGSGDAVQTGGGTLPASATTSVASFISYMQQLVATRPDFDEPVQLGTAVLPTSDTLDPTAF